MASPPNSASTGPRRGGPAKALPVVAVVMFAVIGLVVSRLDQTTTLSSADRCGTGDRITVAAAPDIAPTLTRLAADFHPAAGGCAVRVTSSASATVLDTLGGTGDRPDVWIPDSSLWGRLGAQTVTAVPASGPSIAASPLVIAMPRPLAQAVARVDGSLTWQDVYTMVRSRQGWSALGHPEWGPVRIGRTPSARSTDQIQLLLALSAAAARSPAAAALRPSAIGSPTVRAELAGLARAPARTATDTAALLAGLRAAGVGAAAARYVSLLPATEQQVLAYNRTGPPLALTAFYATDGSPAADYPYLALTYPRTGARVRAAASAFEAYLRTAAARTALTAAGFRTGVANGPFTTANGLSPRPTATTLAGTPAATYALLRRA